MFNPLRKGARLGARPSEPFLERVLLMSIQTDICQIDAFCLNTDVRLASRRCGVTLMLKALKQFLRDESGATAIEYGLLAAGICGHHRRSNLSIRR